MKRKLQFGLLFILLSLGLLKADSKNSYMPQGCAVYTFLTDTVCDFYQFNNQYITMSGTYTDTLVSVAGCDSIIQLDIIINYATTFYISQQACMGSSVIFNNQVITQPGKYYDTLLSQTGCDSIIELDINFMPPQPTYSLLNGIACNNSSYYFNGQNLTTGGLYYDTIPNYIGCDSFITLKLSFTPPNQVFITQVICNGNAYVFNGQSLTTAGLYHDTLVNIYGCDSFVTLNLITGNASFNAFNAYLCSGNSYPFGSQILTQPGIYTDTFINYLGCDSIAELHLAVGQSSTPSSFYDTSCSNQYYYFNGQYIYTSGTYNTIFQNVMGCDSAVTLYLTVMPTGSGTATDSLCEGGSPYIFNNIYYLYYTGSYYFYIGKNNMGCDSFLMLTLTAKTKPTVNAGQDTTICNGTECVLHATGCASYAWTGGFANGSVFYPSTTTNYIVTGYGANGCSDKDTVKVTVVTPPPIPTITNINNTLYSSAASGNQWYMNNAPIAGETNDYYTATQSGNYYVCATSANGCTTCSNSEIITIDFPDAINDVVNLNKKLYPNPTNNVLGIYIPNIKTVSVVNSLSQNIECNIINLDASKCIINTSKLATGVYFVTVVSSHENTAVLKFVKE